MNNFTHKGYGRIYCENVTDIVLVEAVIKELDEYEFGYMPSGLVAPHFLYPNVVYIGKFSDLDMDKLTAVCWSRGIKIWVFDSGYDEHPRNEVLGIAARSEP